MLIEQTSRRSAGPPSLAGALRTNKRRFQMLSQNPPLVMVSFAGKCVVTERHCVARSAGPLSLAPDYASWRETNTAFRGKGDKDTAANIKATKGFVVKCARRPRRRLFAQHHQRALR